jgi:uncharacterized protein (DUF433 family)
MNYQNIITIQPGKRGGRPTIRGMRIAVADVLGWLAAGMTHEEIISDYPELTEEDIRACLACAADRERRARYCHDMKLLFDQNLSFKLCRQLADIFPDSNQIRLLGMAEAEDQAVWE